MHVSPFNKLNFMDIQKKYATYTILNKEKIISPKSLYLSLNGIKELLIKSRQPMYLLNLIAKKFNITIRGISDPKNIFIAQNELGKLINVFNKENYVLEYRIGKYRIDLYFEDYNLAIECDEHGHKYYNKENELLRKKYITKKLKCKFIRFDPNSKDYNIFDVISKIYYFIK